MTESPIYHVRSLSQLLSGIQRFILLCQHIYHLCVVMDLVAQVVYMLTQEWFMPYILTCASMG